jgi:hypothetical protein
VILVLPVILLINQLDERYGAAHLRVGETSVISVRLTGGTDPFTAEAALTCGPGAIMDAGPVRIPGVNEISWRVLVQSDGTHDAELSIEGREYPFRLVAEPAHWKIGRSRGARALDPLIHPSMPPFPDGSGIEQVRVGYPRASYPLLFWRVHWLVIFLVYSVIGAAAIKLLTGFEI